MKQNWEKVFIINSPKNIDEIRVNRSEYSIKILGKKKAVNTWDENILS